MTKKIVLLLAGLALTGCQPRSFGPYVSPRVTGRVLAADTHQGLPDAKVVRGKPEPLAEFPPKGAELLLRKGDILTDRDGGFIVPSERVLTLFRWGGWNSVRLSVEHSGYLRFQTNYSITNLTVTESLGGEPTLKTGDILLRPAPTPRQPQPSPAPSLRR